MHKIAQKSWSEGIFRAYDIRGRYPEEINEDAAYKIARAFARYLKLGVKEKENLKIVVSADARKSSPALKKAFLDGLLDEGAEIVDAGLTTTPMHYFIVNKTEADGGAMITASHIPQPTNGIKLSKKGAIPIGQGFGMEEIKNDTIRGIFAADRPQGKISKQNFLKDYLNFFEGKFPDLKKCCLKIVVDAGNGMTSIVLRKLFLKFPNIKVEFLHDDLDMTFPNHEANPLKPETTLDVQRILSKGGYDLGISFDADGDRVGFIDEVGNRIGGDIIMVILARHFVSPGKAAVYDLRASRVVREEIELLGGKPVESRVGHTFIKQTMRKENAVFGGEFSGHYYFQGFFFAESALFAMFQLLNIIFVEKKKISGLARPHLRYFKSEEINFEVDDREKIIDKIASYFPDAKISYLDGIKIEYPNWWFNLRPAANENLVRLNLEASTPQLFSEKKKLLSELINA